MEKLTSSSDREEPTISFAYLSKENTLYNLTPFNQKRLEIPFVQLQASDLAGINDVVDRLPSNLSLRQFLGFSQHKLYLANIHPMEQRTRGINNENEISLKSKNSFINFSLQNYLKFITQLKPEYIVCMSEEKFLDPRMQQAVGRKSDRRSVKKMLHFFDQIQAHLHNEAGFSACGILLPVINTEFSDVRVEMINHIKERLGQSAGVVVYGIELGKQTDAHIESIFNDIHELVRLIEGTDKILCAHGQGDPVNVLHKVNMGFNFFEAWYPFELAKEGVAINFNPEEWIDSYGDFSGHLQELENGRLKPGSAVFQRKVPLLSLRESSFMQHKDSLFPLWDAYPLKDYSKAYICHLLNNNEMTGNVLLTLHNCFVYQQFFKALNHAKFRKNRAGLIYAFCKYVCC